MRAREVGVLEVVRVHMLAGRDGLRGVADDLVVAAHVFARGNRACGDLVAGRHQAGDGDAFVGDGRAAEQLRARDDDVVARVDADGG